MPDQTPTDGKLVAFRRGVTERVMSLLEWVRVNLPYGPLVLGLISSALSALLAVFILDPDGVPRLGFLLPTIFFALVSILATVTLEVWRKMAADSELQRKATIEVTIKDAFVPIMRQLTMMAVPGQAAKSDRRNAVMSQVANAMQVIVPDAARLRVAVYTLVRARGSRPRALAYAYAVGRDDVPRKIEDKVGTRGRAVWQWLETGKPMFVADTHEGKTESQREHRGYQTYISVPIKHGAEVLGMLTIDAPIPGDLDEANISVVTFAASVLSVAFAHAGPPEPME